MKPVFKYIVVISLFCVVFTVPAGRVHQAVAAAPDEASSPKTVLVISAIGDIMMPASIQNAAARQDHQYEVLFEKISRDLSLADITFANLETPVDHLSPVSGYPKFNSRPELLAALKKAGVKIVSVANNHALDAGPGGLIRTLDNIEGAGLLFAGAGKTRDDADHITYIRCRGVTTAFLAYTYGTNDEMPRKKAGMPVVNLLGTDSEPDLARVTASVRKARLSADLVVVSLHWSDEYRTVPTLWQRRVATELIEAGADAILGHHPHVLQPLESYTTQDGRVGLIAFSLGNFISTQHSGVSNRNKTNDRALRGDGIILTIYVSKENGRISITRAEFLPLWTLRDNIGKTVVYRTVSIDREISGLLAKKRRTRQDENTLQLLAFRKNVITDALIVKPLARQNN